MLVRRSSAWSFASGRRSVQVRIAGSDGCHLASVTQQWSHDVASEFVSGYSVNRTSLLFVVQYHSTGSVEDEYVAP